ncbi:hypothetical protein FEM03_14030 [Phragmitibacter flavus]|uniref:Uncharacterized protein n=1 Tax=Phragmitibacter flavus TaxID=2576071 RepID=A0A5R8KFC2_9BACT|nr:secretin N-terminal domain-containing protein [Phragmitibacter flavus]TLD70299.1 hypothetical protein FEM03_14030 [Phragmitibacter flavus]
MSHPFPCLSAIFLLLAPALHAQIRESAINQPTATNPREFRLVQNIPLADRPPTSLLVQVQNPPPTPDANAPAEPPPGPGGPGMGGPRGGFGGFGGPRGGGSSSSDETFRIDGDKVSLQFPNNSIIDILGIYERLTNKTLIKDTSIFEGQTISLVTPQPVEKGEAIKLIEASLLTNGYAIVADPDGKSARILPTRTQGAATTQFSQGVLFYQSANDLPDNETIVSYFMPLANLDPVEAAEMLGAHVGLSVYGRITPVLNPPGLLLTESSNIVKQLVSIKEVIDTPSTTSSLVTKFIPLKYADAATVAQIVQATIDAQTTDSIEKGITTIRGGSPQQTQQRGSDRDRQQQSQQPQSAPQSGNQTSSSKITPEPRAQSQVVADSRLNQILIVAEPEDYAYISSLILEFDKPVDVPEPYERKLKNIFSLDVVSVLADLLKDTTASTQLPGGGTLTQQQQQLVSSNQLVTGRTATSTRGGTFSGATGGGTTTDTGGVNSRPDQLIEPEEDNAPVSVLVNKTRIIADPLANAILVIGPKEDQDKVNLILDKLDRKPPQVYLATVIGQLTLGDGYEFGIDYLQKFTRTGSNSGLTSSLISTRDDIITSNNVSDITTNLITSAIGNANGFNVYGQIGETVDAFVNALETTNNFKVLSRPSVFALNNKKASITSGQSIPVPSQSITNSNNTGNGSGNVTTTIEYKDVVLKLEVIPLINPDGDVTLKIAQVNDTVVGSQIVDNNSIPIIGTEQLLTTATVQTGNTIVLGGLITEQDNTTTEGIPVISRIPGVGRLFKNDVTSKERKELIVFIQPIVVDGHNDLARTSAAEDLRTKVGADAAQAFPQRVTTPAPTSIDLPASDPEPVKRKRWFNFGR